MTTILIKKGNRFNKFLTKYRHFALIVILFLIIVFFSLSTEYFLRTSNILNVLRQISPIAIVGIGMTLVIILGDIDLSPGSLIAFIGVMAARIFQITHSAIITLISALVIGFLVGLINGFVITAGKIPAFIATLATMQIFRGIAFIYTKGNPIAVYDPEFTWFGTGHLWIIPLPVIFMIFIIIVGVFITKYTRIGRYIYAIGGNIRASRWSGINVNRIKMYVFGLMGFLTGLAALIQAARLGSGQPSAANGFEMDVIAAVILGGASLSGGKGKILNTLIGVIIIGIIGNGLTLMNISSYWQNVVKGIIIVLAVFIDQNIKE